MTLDVALFTLFADRQAPNGRLVRENFADWFGRSAICDVNGFPLVVYHGTKADFDTFEATGENGSAFGRGYYFTNSAKAAAEWSKEDNRRKYALGGNVIPVYLAMQKPAIFPDEDSYFGRAGVMRSFVGNHEKRDAFNEELRKNGHDGLIIRRTLLPGKPIEYVVFDTRQIKSAVGNSGGFYQSDPDMTDRKAISSLEHRQDFVRRCFSI